MQRKQRQLSVWGLLALILVYLALIQGVGLLVGHYLNLSNGKFESSKDIVVGMWIPLGLAAAFVYGSIFLLGWWRAVFHETKKVQSWIWFIPIVFIIAILFGINYGALAERGLLFTLTLLIATQLVGWGEEGMFRGISIITLRQHKLTEARVALLSSVIFGAVHITNAIGGGGSKAFLQALAVSFAGYFFYLIRRVSGSNILNSVLHGLFDFMILTSVGIVFSGGAYAGSGLAILVYLIVGIVLLVKRRNIELVRKN